MRLALLLLALPLLVHSFPPIARGADRKPDRTIEIVRKGGKVVFAEKGKPAGRAVQVVVGETVRWVNRDDRPHTLTSLAESEGKPLMDTKPIPPGEHKDVLFDIDLYRRAGGRAANYVRFKYRADDGDRDEGELIFLSAARR